MQSSKSPPVGLMKCTVLSGRGLTKYYQKPFLKKIRSSNRTMNGSRQGDCDLCSQA